MPADDRLLRTTLWTSILIVPVLVSAFVVLYLFPGDTRRLWAWTITPDLTAMVMGGGYLSGAYFFTRVATTRRWHRVGIGFLATTVFTTMLLLATLVHWDRFNHDHVSFWAWLGLYVVTPLLLPALWAANHRTDPGRSALEEVRLHRGLRVVVGVVGVVQLSFAAVMFVRPAAVMGQWPWELTPLTTRTLAAFIAFPAVTWVCFLVDDRWSSFEIPVQTATIGLVLVGVAVLRSGDDLQGAGGRAPLLVASLAATIVALLGLQLAMHSRRRTARPR